MSLRSPSLCRIVFDNSGKRNSRYNRQRSTRGSIELNNWKVPNGSIRLGIVLIISGDDNHSQLNRITKRLRRIPNVRHFWFASGLAFTAQWFK